MLPRHSLYEEGGGGGGVVGFVHRDQQRANLILQAKYPLTKKTIESFQSIYFDGFIIRVFFWNMCDYSDWILPILGISVLILHW